MRRLVGKSVLVGVRQSCLRNSQEPDVGVQVRANVSDFDLVCTSLKRRAGQMNGAAKR